MLIHLETCMKLKQHCRRFFKQWRYKTYQNSLALKIQYSNAYLLLWQVYTSGIWSFQMEYRCVAATWQRSIPYYLCNSWNYYRSLQMSSTSIIITRPSSEWLPHLWINQKVICTWTWRMPMFCCWPRDRSPCTQDTPICSQPLTSVL